MTARQQWISLIILLFAAAPAALADKPKIAVMRFEAQSPAVKDKVDQLTAKLSGQLAKLGDFTVLPDNEVRQQQKRLCNELSVCNPADVAPDLGKNLHADWVFIPYVTMEGDYINLTVTVISISTSAQSSGYDVTAKGGVAELYDSIGKLVEQAGQDQTLFLPKDGGGAVIPTAVQDDLNAAELLAKQGKAEQARTHADAARKAGADNHVVLQRALAVYESIGDADRALETVNAWLNLPSTANLPARREMTKKQIQIKENLAEIKRIGEQANEILSKLQAAFERKDAEAAWRLYEELQKLKPDHPGIAAWKPKVETLESPAQREQRLERERIAAQVKTALEEAEKALQAKDADKAERRLSELERLAPSHEAISGLRKRLEEIQPVLTLALGGGVKMELVRIQAGEFWMGSPDSEENRDSDEVRHKVRLTKPFYMGKYEVTQSQWQAVMGNNPSSLKGDSLPVESVSWDDCQEFCRKLSQKSGKPIRLPTEAEWEYACRAGSTSPFSFGNTISTSQANYDGNYTYGNGSKGEYRQKTTRVGSFAANAWGLFDMHGNVLEWCQDRYGDYPSGSVTDPTGSGSGSDRVLRGGSWVVDPGYCRSADRGRGAPGFRVDFIGFRVVSGTP